MSQLAITVLGHDRPGIIAATTNALADLGVNIEDSSMTLLRGHFAMTLVTDGAVGVADVTSALGFLEADGTLTVTVREVPAEIAADRGAPYALSVHGGDRPGIVAGVAGAVARAEGNITDLSTRLAGGLYVLVAECDFPASADMDAVQALIASAADGLGVRATLRAVEPDEL